jgi:hypothetical protein
MKRPELGNYPQILSNSLNHVAHNRRPNLTQFLQNPCRELLPSPTRPIIPIHFRIQLPPEDLHRPPSLRHICRIMLIGHHFKAIRNDPLINSPRIVRRRLVVRPKHILSVRVVLSDERKDPILNALVQVRSGLNSTGSLRPD